MPEYYEQIKLPVAIDTVEKKLKDRKYSSLSEIESDIKRMVQNAKEYNLPKSPIFNDAERVRKMAFNFMKQHNPAYRDSNYVAVATPVPDTPIEKTTKLRLHPPSKVSLTTNLKANSGSGSPAVEESSGSGSAKPKSSEPPADPDKMDGVENSESREAGGFKGLTFQDAQNKIINDIMEHVEPESELKIFEPFVQLPSRKLKDYYVVIKHPTSLKQVMKKVHGWHSREEQTGVTDLRTWDAFEHEVARIWENARTYNEDGSEMYQLAIEFEQDFKRRLREAKSSVEEPAQPKIKLNVGEARPSSSGLKLKLGSQKQSPVPSPIAPTMPTSGSPASAAGQPAVNEPVATQPKVPPPGTGSSQARSIMSPALAAKTPNGVSAPPVQQSQPNGSMPPPSFNARPTSSNNSSTSVGPVSSTQPNHYVPQASSASINSFDSKWRPKPAKISEGSTTSEADILMSKLHVATHPDAIAKRPLRLAIPADKILSQQSITTSLGAEHSALRVTAELTDQLKAPNARAYRLFVYNNGVPQSQRVVKDYNQLYGTMVNGVNGTGGSVNAPQKDSGPSWDIRLQPGTNRIEVECVAAAKQGSGSNDLVKEKVSLFVFQMKA